MIYKICNDFLKIHSTNFKHQFNARMKSHYEVLNLSRNCTSKEIKNAFITLSKKYHPDISNCQASEKHFVRISEAYKVLSKADLRRNYDLGLISPTPNTNNYDYHSNVGARSPWHDRTFYTNRDKSKDFYYANQPYYGIKGVDRVSNKMIVVICVMMATFGFGLQMIAISNTLALNREKLINISNDAEENLKKSRLDAEINGNKVQIELLKEKMKQNKTLVID